MHQQSTLALSDKEESAVCNVVADLKREYCAPTPNPWIVGFSGGKDSTFMLHLLVEAILEIPHSQRTRPVHIIANDTLVESPIVAEYVDRTLLRLKASLDGLGLPVVVQKTEPLLDHTFWVNLIGRGYPAPTRMFRWCTDRMKIRPTTEYIRRCVSETGEVVLLLGVRRSESSARAKSAKRYDGSGKFNRHNDIQGCLVYRPILEIDTDTVWEFLAENAPPWGGSHDELIKLYRDAAGGECPLVIDPDAAPSCGSNSIRFGCWTCTVVEKDRSFRNSMEGGLEHLEPMADFRDWLKEFCYRSENRMTVRRNGTDGIGPLTFDARREVFRRLRALEKQAGLPLLSDAEAARIHEIWQDDKAMGVTRRATRLLGMVGES